MLATSAPVAPPALDPSRLSPWRLLGTPVDQCATAHQALRHAGLAGWNIRKLPLSGSEITDHGVDVIDAPDQVMLVRTDPRTGRTHYLSTVGSGYRIWQNEDQADVLDALCGQAKATGFTDAGSLNGGRTTFVTMRLPDGVRVVGDDHIDLYLVAFNTHDGSGAFRVCLVPFRVSCANQLRVAIAHAVSQVALRHTRRAHLDIAEIRHKLGLMDDYAGALDHHVHHLVAARMTTPQFEQLVNELWPVTEPLSARARANHDRRTDHLLRLWSHAPTQESVRGSRFAAWMAVTEYLDHHAPATAPQIRARRVLTSAPVTHLKQHAFDLLTT
ncbi:DUF932 domain-containing protein [Streptoalloteichus hindustanus]|uniref:Phage/plasmid-like protein TIGR03299 n=1 Tax=Streptoalloteichus hindustanus TaxID=2017 RepID=A0A1M5MBU4_STRHI|nr:DUF932 domain-containing protein [Streptoalloteichus hindustanus]SHG74736.1 phage/plasmid-like protein TIGR03299 [Streptoalloteichus hindustanus]